LFQTLFNEVSLSPYTDFVDKTLAFLEGLEKAGGLSAAQVVDLLGWLLRQVGRHLTAYDLVTFHHRGANYPDALLLDAVLKAYLTWIERRSDLFTNTPAEDEPDRRARRLRRRALRQGWLLRRRHEGRAVPDLPTSPGENSRVLPGQPRVPEEQILEPARRRRFLYAEDPLPNHLGPHGAAVLQESIADLDDPGERRELGLGLFLDRPFGCGKKPAEPDGTLLLTAEAFSRSIAVDRLHFLGREGLLSEADVRRLADNLDVSGLPLDAVGGAAKPGTVSLADARRAATDFVFLRTVPGSVAALLAQFDFAPLAAQFPVDWLTAPRRILLARAPDGPHLRVYDDAFRPRLELEVQTQLGYASRANQEDPLEGLRVVRVWEETPGGQTLRVRDLETQSIVLPPR
jgi:hypothetical protein